jgi:hypothetical protein
MMFMFQMNIEYDFCRRSTCSTALGTELDLSLTVTNKRMMCGALMSTRLGDVDARHSQSNLFTSDGVDSVRESDGPSVGRVLVAQGFNQA